MSNSYAFNLNNRMTQLTDPDGSITRWLYNPRGLLAAKILPAGQFSDTDTNGDGYPDARALVYTYDAAQRLSSRLDQALQRTGYAYDMGSRLLQTSYPDGLDDTFAYDNDGRQILAVSARYGNAVAKSYTANGLQASETTLTGDETNTLTYAYDAANRQTAVNYPNGQQVTRTWTPRNRLATVAVNGTTIATYSRDVGNRTIGLAYGNGVVNNWEYRGDNQIRRVAAIRDGQTITDFAYSLDADKRRTAEQNGVTPLLSNGYGYDQKDQLTTWNRTDGKTGAWNLSPGGDWNSVTYDGLTETRTHDAAHELLARNAQPLTYDSRGNLLTDNHGNVYAWDVENRLISVEETTSPAGRGRVRVDFVYDTQWRRVAKTVHTWSTDHWTLSTSHTFTYDGWNLIREQSNGPTVQPSDSDYIWGEDLSGTLQGAGGIGGLLAGFLTTNEEPGTKNLVYYHYQANGNVMALTDANGALAASYAYNPYGTLLAATGPLAMRNPMRFSTK